MYRKIYGTNHSDLSTVIMVGGKEMRIEFTGGVPIGYSKTTAKYATSDPKIQGAIENDPRYGSEFFLVAMVEMNATPREEKNGKVKAYNYIKRMQDAVNVLATNHGVPLSDMNNKEEVLAAAKKKGVSFPNMR